MLRTRKDNPMKTAKELYSEYIDENDLRYDICEYQPILDEFGTILIQVDDKDYEGDSRILYLMNEKYGYLQFGWGSCSGCDSLQACNTMKEINDLIQELHQSIVWFDTKKECLHWFQTHDWKGEYSYRHDEQREFIDAVTAYLTERITP